MSTPSSLDSSFIIVDDDRDRPLPVPVPSPLSQVESAKVESTTTTTTTTAVEKDLKQDFPATHPSLDTSYSPGSSFSYAHDWSRKATGGGIFMDGRHFVDAYGRVCNLRGVNLSGSSKTPTDHDHENFPGDHRIVTFVGRPFPLEEAPEHFARLRRWGLTFIRFLVTWEAVEHAGPGIYDTSYLSYIRSLLSLLPAYGLSAFISMHQDVWSRYSGGSGAPAWTLELVGFDLHAIEESGGAWLHGQRGGGHVEAERGLWPCGYHKLVASTMSTCFWAGDVYTPKLRVKNKHNQEVSIQQFLQNCFLDMWDMVARAVGDLEGVVGFQMINEPHPGYVNASMHGFNYNTDLHLSHIPSAFQSFQLGSGHPTLVPTYTRSFPMPTKLTHHTLLNSAGVKAWRADGPTGGRCLWEYHDVWRWDTVQNRAVVLRENYFKVDPETGRKVDWGLDFYLPLIRKWSERVRQASSADKLVFIEPIPNEFCPPTWTKDKLPQNLVFAPHWYDLNALFAKAFGNFTVNVQGISRGMFPLKAFYWGHKGARDNFSLQIRNIVEKGYLALGEKPVLIGECGIPMDMNKGDAFRTGNFEPQMRMMDAMITALDRSLIGFTLWNYNPDNDDFKGDDWNGENFSWFSRSRASPSLSSSLSSPSSLNRYSPALDQTSPALDEGGRILPSLVRPYPAKTAGIPLRFEYEMNDGSFSYEWADPVSDAASSSSIVPQTSTPSVSNPPLTLTRPLKSRETEIFLPSLLTHGRKVVVEGLDEAMGDRWAYDERRQTLFVVTGTVGCVGEKEGRRQTHKIRVSLEPPLKRAFVVNDFWSDFGVYVGAVLALLLAVVVYWLGLLGRV